MRNLIFALLAANILFFLWPKENLEPPPPLKRGAKGLPLLIQLVEIDERPSADSLVPTGYTPVIHEPPRTVRVAVPQPEVTRIKAPMPPQAVKPTAATVATKSKTANTTSPPASATLVEATGKPSVGQPVAGQSHPPAPQPSSQPARPSPAPVVVHNLSCYTLGPFSDRKSADDAASELRSIGATTSIRNATERRTRGYWVYLPPQRSREQALKRAEQLAAKGFSDYFVVADGKHDNAISLGLFTLKKGSQRRVEQLQAMGFKPKVEVRYTDLPVYWLDYEIDHELDWPAFIQEKFPKGRVDQLKRACN